MAQVKRFLVELSIACHQTHRRVCFFSDLRLRDVYFWWMKADKSAQAHTLHRS